MKTKTKLSLGITFLFILILGMSGASIYFIRILAKDSGQIIKDNLISIDYVQQMNAELDSIHSTAFEILTVKGVAPDVPRNVIIVKFDNFQKSVDSEANNIT